MKNITLIAALILTSFLCKAGDDEEAPLTSFSVETNYTFNSSIKKHALNLGAYYWFNRKYMLGTEFYSYFPSRSHKFFDFQVDVNFRKYLVDWHPYSFFVLIGPAYRNYVKVDNVNDTKSRVWNFDGLNLGFGFNIRHKNNSFFVMPKINHKDAKFQIAAGYRYHFNVSTSHIFHNKYKLRKARKKD